MPLKNLLFDLDGTLSDPREGICRCFQFALHRLGRAAPALAELEHCIGPPIRDSFGALLNTTDPAFIELAVKHYRERFSTVGLFENTLYPTTVELLEVLSGRFPLFVVTLKPEVYAEQILRHFGVRQAFGGVYGPGLEPGITGKTELVHKALNDHGLRAEQTMMIGDRRDDIIAGRSNGTHTMGVLYGFGSFEELAAEQPDLLCREQSDIPAAITRYSEG
ncbi:MAG: HAD hydrolase-like protein [Bdellovibrionota bacterium]